jgi:hypothetical protein
MNSGDDEVQMFCNTCHRYNLYFLLMSDSVIHIFLLVDKKENQIKNKESVI